MQLLRKFLCCIAIFGLVSQLSARQRTAQQAQQVAARFVKATRAEVVTGATAPIRSTSAPLVGSTPYYLFNDAQGNGFVIVAADDRLPEVVGYSSHGSIDQQHMPKPLRAYLENVAQHAAQVKGGSAVLQGNIHRVKRYPKEIVPPLVKTKWNQGFPYNKYCPMGMPTGCVATAMAQLMYLHQWPEVAVDLPRTDAVENAESTRRYAWDKMQLSYESHDNDEVANDAVARLMRDAGLTVFMKYAFDGSRARTIDAKMAFRQNFGYAAHYVRRSTYGDNEFRSIITTELNQGFPMLIAGYGARPNGEGHAWVLDGYDENGFCHMNWGWGGMGDGYFDLRYLSPTHRGIGGGDNADSGFSKGIEIVLLHPERKDKEVAAFPGLLVQLSMGEEGAIRVDQQHAMKGEKITATLVNVTNRCLVPLRGVWGIGLFDESGKLQQVFESSEFGADGIELSSDATYTAEKHYALDFSNTAIGHYSLRPVAQLLQPTASGGYHRSDWTLLSDEMQVAVEVSADGITIQQSTDTVSPLVSLSAPQLTAVARVGGEGAISFVLQNRQMRTIYGQLLLKLTPVDAQNTPTLASQPTEVKMGEFRHWKPFEIWDDNLKFDAKGLASGRYRAQFIFAHSTDERGRTSIDSVDEFYVQVALFPHKVEADELLVTDNSFYRAMQTRDQFNLDTDQELCVGAALRNTGESTFSGEVVYRLRDVSSGDVVELGKQHVDLLPNSQQSPSTLLLPFRPQTVGVKAQRLYCFEVLVDGIDIWRVGTERCYLDFVETASPITAISQGELSLVVEQRGDELCVETAAHAVISVYDLSGRCRARSLSPQSRFAVKLPAKGYYLVHVGNFTRKVLVK